MKGKSERRRRKNALSAASGNLYKAQFGKASKWDALPDAPSGPQLKPWVPRSVQKIRKLMALNESTDKNTAQEGAPVKSAKQRKNKFSKEAAPTTQADANPEAQSLSGGTEARNVSGTQSSASGRPAAAATIAHMQPLGKTKLKRKEHLKQKKKLKRLRSQVAKMGGARAKDDEDSDFEQDHVQFGEVAAAPPKANLKRRHWDAEQTREANQNRHKEIMLKHLRTAEARVAKSTQNATVDPQARRKALIDEQIHQQVVNAYREQKGRNTAGATMQSLKALVRSKGPA